MTPDVPENKPCTATYIGISHNYLIKLAGQGSHSLQIRQQLVIFDVDDIFHDNAIVWRILPSNICPNLL